ncbi:probable serine/threonine-protein kinase samkC [Camellia sinensis]|uniref:probable serine/threonine-protein kinase samkC n=1 Tax=Camellia sinensis TaxID=4442 RepID=UPI001035842E|nr:probable serine/threonine-protein kinase samkC [Camellia sinensis]
MAATPPSSTPAPPSPPTSPSPQPQDQDQDQNHEPSSSPSPTPTPSNPESPKPLQSISPPKKIQPLPWTHPETVNLIQAYQEKWYSLKRGQLKSNQWEEVAITVAARCGYDEPSKSAIQCRHKLEKLRKRFRAEKQKPYPHAWEYFDLMDSMERGPLPISARPMAMVQFHKSNPNDEEDDDNDNDEEVVNETNCIDTSKRNKSKSINHLVNAPSIDWKLRSGSDRVSVIRRPCERFEEEEEEEEGEDEEDEEDVVVVGGGGRETVVELAAEIKAFAERLVKMESKKMEMMRETERYRMEMENKRIEMILDSQRKIVDTIGRAFGSHNKKLKMAQDF